MEIIRPGTKLNFMGFRAVALGVSVILVAVCLAGILAWPGPNWGIDFAGGAEMQVAFNKKVDMSELRGAVESLGLGEVKVQEWIELGDESGNKYLIRMEELDIDKKTESALPESMKKPGPGEGGDKASDASGKSAGLVSGKLTEVFGQGSFEVLKTDYVGPRVGDELRRNGIMAIIIAMVLLLAYISLRFEFRFAVGAVLALAHDVIITTGAFVLLHKEFNLAIIAALLTIVGYSLNDTIVVYDRIRENFRRLRRLGFQEMVNSSINEVLSRTILTSMTTLVVVFFLWLLGGGVIHDFAFAMLVGVMVGTYSSIFVAGSFLIWWDSIRARKRSPAVEARTRSS